MSASDLRRVMVAFDSDEEPDGARRNGIEGALERALGIARNNGAGILVLQTCYDPVADEPSGVLPSPQRRRFVEELTAAHERHLGDLLAPYRRKAPGMESRLLWARDPAGAIIDAAARWRAQLLIKPVSRHRAVADFFHTPLDWALMREAPCPVVLARNGSWRTDGRILAAVDAADEQHAGLSREIIRRAHALAEILGARLDVATAYPDLGRAVDRLEVGGELAGIEAELTESRRRRLVAMLDELGITAVDLHLVKGKPAREIAALAERLDAQLTVVGTSARHGMARLVIGNTAEELVGRLGRDLMTVRAPWS